ncbi:hypothetical protein BBJ28_00000328 [Nothophytophthora sp. Chile5]|nr:hypothetical protein BBJ28_00000328 [Nothophytophthora sp. Chile5]
MQGSLPISFGGSRGQPSRKRQRTEVDTAEHLADEQTEAELDTTLSVVEDTKANDPAAVEAPLETAVGDAHESESSTPQIETTLVEKVRVKYDSDGEVAERVVEHVEVAVGVDSVEKVNHEHKNSSSANADADTDTVATKKTDKYPGLPRCAEHMDLTGGFPEGRAEVTPQPIAEHVASRLRCDVVVDPFAGCGGNVIQLAMTCKQVIAIDIDPEKIRMAKHNAAIYGVAHKIEWIVGNSIEILPTLKADVVFLSPPWGGQNYSRKHFRLDDMIVKGVSGVELFAKARQVTKNIAYYLPRTTPTSDLEALSPGEVVECEQIFLNKQLKVVTAYYGSLAASESDKQVKEDDPPMEEAAASDL